MYSVDSVFRDVGDDVDELAVVRLCLVVLNYDLPVCFLCVTVVLLDTTREVELNWTKYPFGPQSKTPGVSTYICDESLLVLQQVPRTGELPP